MQFWQDKTFSLEIKVDGEMVYLLRGKNLTPRELNYGGPCAYLVKCNDYEFTLMHVRKNGLLRLCGNALNNLCRRIERKKVNKEELEFGYKPTVSN